MEKIILIIFMLLKFTSSYANDDCLQGTHDSPPDCPPSASFLEGEVISILAKGYFNENQNRVIHIIKYETCHKLSSYNTKKLTTSNKTETIFEPAGPLSIRICDNDQLVKKYDKNISKKSEIICYADKAKCNFF